MSNNQAGQSGSLNINNLQETAMNVVDTFCSIVCRPAELILRPWHGTRYFPVPVIFLSTGMMLFLPIFSAVALGAVSMIPLVHLQMPASLFDIGTLSQLYFLLSVIHSVRLYRRMIDMSLETNSTFEGPALPFFALVPRGGNFWFCRIVIEPAFLIAAAMVLGHLYVFSPGLSTFLEFSGICLAMKNFIGWYRGWEYIRNLIDMRYAGPIIARLAENRASDEELAQVHLASFPKNLSPDLRKAAISHLARAVSPESQDAAGEVTS